MTARKNDYESKKFILDIWSATWDKTTSNRIKYFEDCIPANGFRSMRNVQVWGTDPSRKQFLVKARKQARQVCRSWRSDFSQRKLRWKKASINLAQDTLSQFLQIKTEYHADISDIEKDLKKRLPMI